jgi:hypothetical protein
MGGGISSSLEPPPIFTKCGTKWEVAPISKKMPKIVSISNFIHFFYNTGVAPGNSCDHILVVMVSLGLITGWDRTI